MGKSTSDITVQGVKILQYEEDESDFFSLTDMTRHKDTENMDTIIQNWMKIRNTIEPLCFCETIYNPNLTHRIRGV